MIVKDANGLIHKELVRTPAGGISVGDKSAYDRYLREKKQLEEIKELNSRLNTLETMVKTLIEKVMPNG